MSGIIDIVCNLYTPQTVAEGRTGLDDVFADQVRVPEDMRGGAKLNAEELAAFCEGRLARFKTPRRVETLPALPRNAYGKVLKGKLRNYGYAA